MREKKLGGLKRSAIVVFVLLLIAILAFQVGAASGKSIEYPAAGQALVYNDKGLYTALKDGSINYITFANDITVSRYDIKINSKRSKGDLVIDGNNFRLVEYHVKTWNSSKAIRLLSTGTMKSITVQNMNIVGQNGYGNIYVDGCAKNVTLHYKNVTYKGPQLIHNEKGTAILEDCNIHIAYANYGKYMGEVAEANKVILKGAVNIYKENDTDGCADEIFYLRNSGGSFRVDPGATVAVEYNIKNQCTPGGFIYACYGYDFTVGEGASLSYKGYREFMEGDKPKSLKVDKNASMNVYVEEDSKKGFECRALIRVEGNVLVDEGATFNVTTSGKLKYSLLRVDGNLNVKPDANFVLLAEKNKQCSCICEPLLYMKGGKYSSIVFDRPANLVIYNSNNNTDKYARALGYVCAGDLTITGYHVAFWYTAPNTKDYRMPDVLENADKVWENPDASDYTVKSTICGGSCGTISRLTTENYTGSEKLDKSTFSQYVPLSKCKYDVVKVIAVNGKAPEPEQSEKPVIDDVEAASTLVTGTGVPGSTITVYWPNGGSNITSTATVDDQGYWRVNTPSGVTLVLGDIIYADQKTDDRPVSERAQITVSILNR